MTPLLEVESLVAKYGDFQALFGIDLSVEEGEVFAVVGANGAGKSTLLNTLAGLVRVADGRLRFDGSPIERTPVHRRVEMGISLVPEGRRIFPSLSVDENLAIGGYRRRAGSWSRRRVYDTFPLLAGITRRSAAVLSGGEQQTLAIARALMANPRLLLLDEVSLGLAPIVVQQLYDAVPSIVAGGTTIVLVEQDITQALRVADRFVCLLEGRVSLAGQPSEVSRDELSASYFGTVES